MDFFPTQNDGDLITFDDHPEEKNVAVSEIQRLFDPLFQQTPISNKLTPVHLPCQTAPPIPPKPSTLSAMVKNILCNEDSSRHIDMQPTYFESLNDDVKFTDLFILTDELGSPASSKSSSGNNLTENQTNFVPVMNAVNRVHMRSRRPTVHDDRIFLPDGQSSAELDIFLETVQSIYQSCTTRTECCMTAYDQVYGAVSPSSGPDETSSILPWTTKTGASSVGHLQPLGPKPESLDVITPSHLRDIPSWSIPQLEVRITSYLASQTHRERNNASPRSPPPQLRLVCDPNTTLVNELLMEALNSDVLSAGVTPDPADCQFRILGRAEYLHPTARLRDCNQVQVCHRLDQPLNLVLESRTSHSQIKQDAKEPPHYNPQAYFSKHFYRTPTEEEVLIAYNIFKTTLDKVRSITSGLSPSQRGGPEWLKEIQCLTSTLSQSVKAVLAVVCQSVAFTDLLNALGQVQVTLLEVIRDSRPVPRMSPASDYRTGSLRDHKKATPPFIRANTLRGPEDNSLGHFLNGKFNERSRAKLERVLQNLHYTLLVQLDAFLRWRQVGMRINPDALQQALQMSRPRRPVGRLVDENSLSDITPEQKRIVRNSNTFTERVSVDLVAVHRVSRIPAHSRQSTDSHSSPDNAIEGSTNANRFRSNTNIHVVLSLLYAGRLLGDIYPLDTAQYSTDHVESRFRIGFLSRDTITSEPGKCQTIQPGFPKILHFDQTLTFTEFGIHQLPKETLLSVSLVSRRMQTNEGAGNSTLLGWVNIPLFDANGFLLRGTVVAGMWPPCNEQLNVYRSTWSQPNRTADCPIVQLTFPHYDFDVSFPCIPSNIDVGSCLSTHQMDVITEAKQALSQATDAILLSSLNPEAASIAANKSWTLYSEATSACHRMGRHDKPYMKLSSLRLGALTVAQSVPSTPASDLMTTLEAPSAIAVEVLWNLRFTLWNNPDALVAFLICVLVTWPQEAHGVESTRGTVWPWVRLIQEVYNVLTISVAITPGLSLRLLAADVADQGIRHWAVRSLALLPVDILLLYIPQLLEAINMDVHFDYSGIASLLLFRAVMSVRFANSLYWQLNANLRASGSPQSLVDWRFRRFLLLKSALVYLAGPTLCAMWKHQEAFIARTLKAACAVKQCKTGGLARDEVMTQHVNELVLWMKTEFDSPPSASVKSPVSEMDSSMNRETEVGRLIDVDDAQSSEIRSHSMQSSMHCSRATNTICHDGFRVPYNPGLMAKCIDALACTYFHSFTCPLRLVFHPMDSGSDPILMMFKAGDDLRQDALIVQMSFLMDRLWLDAGLDLRMIHFRILPTGNRSGLIELVSECNTLRQIQQQGGGLTGPFKETVITKWLQSRNTTELDYKRALDNFLHSLAGCCVMTYVLGIGDRHNDNIMIRYSGHLFHVDFAKIFGNVQTFAGIKRDRVPFVFTPDMLHVLQTYSNEINDQATSLGNFPAGGRRPAGCGGGKEGFQTFIDLCCEAYNVLRRSSHALLSILEMGLSMDIPGINRDSVRYVMRVLKMDLSESQASQHFTELIRKSLQSRMPALNFFVHNLAQAKQSSSNSGSVLSPVCLSPVGHQFNSSDSLDRSTLPRSSASPVLVSARSASAISIPGLSFSPKNFNCTEDGLITAVVVEVAVKKRGAEKQAEYYFPMSVWRQDCRVPNRVYRRFCDLAELCTAIRDQFGSTNTSMILHQLLSGITTGSIASVQTQSRVQELIDYLLEEDETISKSDLTYTFFHSLLFDERFASEDNAQVSAPPALSRTKFTQDLSYFDVLQTPFVNTVTPQSDDGDLLTVAQSTEQPVAGLQLQFCLTESMNQLNVMIKHGRALYIPGSFDPPDVYVKVYLLCGGRKKSTKRKTAVIRRSTDPTFNTTFTYSVTVHDIQCGFLEVSAWHAVSLGENMQLGHICVPIRTLRPGLRVTRWYALSTDWHMV